MHTLHSNQLIYTEQNPDDPSFYSNRAACRLQLKQYKEAYDDSMMSIDKDNKFIKGYFRAGLALLSQGKIDDAKRLYELALRIEPDNREIKNELQKAASLEGYVTRGNMHLQRGEYQEALSQFNATLVLCPFAAQFKVLRAEAMIGLKQFAEAAKYAGAILEDDPNCVDAYFVRGRAAYYQGITDNGMKLVRRALELDPDNARARTFWRQMRQSENLKEEGNAAFKSGSFEAACEKYTQAIEIDPLNVALNASLYCNRAAALTKLSKLDEAVADCDKAIELDETYKKAFMRRGQLLQMLEKHEQAVYDFRKAYELDKSDRSVGAKLKEAEALSRKAKRKDYYKILGVSKDASDDDIKKAYRRACMKVSQSML